MDIVRVALTCFLVSAFVTPTVAGERSWVKEFKKDVKHRMLTSAGVYLVLTERGLYGLDTRTGIELWFNEERQFTSDNMEYIEGTPFLLLSEDSGFARKTVGATVLNVMDGETAWNIGNLSGNVVGTQMIYEQRLLMIYSVGGRDGIAIDAYDAVDGTHRYQVNFQDQQAMGKVRMGRRPGAGPFSTRLRIVGHQEPIFVGDKMVVFYDFLRGIDLKTGRQVWMDRPDQDRPGAADAPMLTSGHAQMQLRDGVVYAPYGDGLAAFEVDSGLLKWRIRDIPGGIVSAMRIEGDRLYYRSGAVTIGSGIKARVPDAVYNCVALKDGKPIWDRFVQLAGRVTNWTFSDEDIHVVLDDRLHTFSKTTGSEGTPTVSGGTFDIKDGIPQAIAISDRGLLARDHQTIALFEVIGGELSRQIWRQYYKSRGPFGSFANRTNTGTRNAYPMSFISRMAGDPRANTWGLFHKNLQARKVRYASSSGYQYIFTKIDGGEGLKGINLLTGEADRDVLLKEKKPDYHLDEAGGMLLLLQKKKLTAFALQGS